MSWGCWRGGERVGGKEKRKDPYLGADCYAQHALAGETLPQLLRYYTKALETLNTGCWPSMNIADGAPWPRTSLNWEPA